MWKFFCNMQIAYVGLEKLGFAMPIYNIDYLEFIKKYFISFEV